MKFTTEYLKSVCPSASATISLRAKKLRASGKDVIDLGLGEPDFDTPPHIIEAAMQAARDGQTRYPPTSGTAALKSAIRAKFARDNALEFSDEQIIVSNGAKQVIFDALMATLTPGDEVILCAPYFDAYRNIIALLGGRRKVVACRAKDGFRLRPEDLEAAIGPRTRWLILNAPSNPTGTVYDADELRALGSVLARHPHVAILSDEIYEHIHFGRHPHVAFAATCPDLADRILTVNGVSKAYAMTGWRIGYGAGPAALIRSMTTVQSQISSGACSVAQAAAAAALHGPQDSVAQFVATFRERRDLVVSAVAGIADLTLVRPDGAFYALIDCSALTGDDEAFVRHLLDNAGVAAVPGSVYEMPGHFRISTACATGVLDDAMRRIAQAAATFRAASAAPHAPA
ncbi:aspartate aminotransferase [Paracoccus pantotrophus]|uniref:Aminotransferase n=1 Tax=Paracoccus pantotrophus TaxID=82367 RepID=A0AAE6NVG7_PARPN|nr:pyridoxal phosphate-dependent aminotransferase [Paracoccus pantotrophus]QFG37346.1 pyridoxal phosphate-dependent aminotransferase [Paracoccus pantotrophus]RKS52215.1 aspartate aminotransferase [Paracoccus pantotrophus]